ncbi:T9SS type A sorting domain-containing protein [Pedobacter xixiisoli]|uniref:Por secretion system C-terminal sorting domain-containing protein n=1 Tax=Pedobacter xixiisoli TaxID=1476464 RepID=A0A285ZPR6_9SPHI|nr:T9SS type A sorting domain-containing protein [Pedobacter xixiisoli]SOD11632.1 Por secretion system C-terminal sorting domain-containing protein [Pedobacter xixiisoli]
MKKLLLSILLLIGFAYLDGNCQVILSTAGTAKVEDFNTLALSGTGTALPTGWTFLETGTSANLNSIYTAGTGSSNTADTYSFGATGSSERTFGMLRSGTLTTTIGASFKNETGTAITKLKISYIGKTWRVGNANRSDKIEFAYSTNATALNAGTYTAVSQLDYENTAQTATANGSVIHSSNISYTITGLNIPADATFWIRFSDFDATGADDGMGIDNFSITPNPTDPEFSADPTSISFGGQNINTVSSERSFVLNYSNLTNVNTSVVTSAPFSISKTSGGTFEQSLSYTQADLNSSNTTIYVKYSPTTVVTTNGIIAITGGGTSTATNVALTGVGLDPNFQITADYTQNFDDANYLNTSYWKPVSVKGSVKTWEHTTSNARSVGAAYMNGYSETETDGDGNQPSDDWLISPKMNLTSFANFPIVNFWTRKWFTGPDIKVYVSTTYNGSGTINLADWTEITSPGLPTTTGTWTKSNNLDLSAYKTAATYIAFRYVTETASNSNAAEWRIDDFSLTNQTATSSIPTNTISFAETNIGALSPSESFTFTSSGYGDITINATGDFELSLDDNTFQASIVVPQADAVSAKTVYARFKPSSAAAQITTTLTFSGTGLNANGPQLKGSSLLKANTFDLATWNMEFFGNGTTIPNYGPANRTQQISNASIVYAKMLPDVIGIQEISDENAVDELLATLPNTYKKKISQVYSYSIKPNNSTDPFPAQKIGFIYNSATVDTVGFRAMFVGLYKDAVAGNTNTISDSFWSSGRLPFIGTFNVTTLDGLKKKVNVVVIHAKSGSTPADYNRRKFDVQVLRDSLAAQYPGENNAIVGDYNDLVLGSIASGQTSPFGVFTSNGYTALTLPLLQASKGTYVGSTNPSMIDNIIVSNELNAFYAANSTAIEDARDYISGYSSNTSDHLAVYSRFSFPVGTLPIKLENFDATANGNVTNIKWTTLTETNNDYFTVGRSTDGVNFITIKTVKGAGNSEEVRNYNVVDENPINGTNYYRLKQTDFNGKYSYSEIKSVKFANLKENVLKIYPNPVINKTAFSLATESAAVQMLVSAIDGKVILRETGSISSLNQKLNSKINQLTTGVYILQLTVDGQQHKAKFIKQ